MGAESLLNRIPTNLPGVLLASCLADEAAARPETVRGAIRELVLHWRDAFLHDVEMLLARGKFGPDLPARARQAFFSPTLNLVDNAFCRLQGKAIWYQTAESHYLSDLQKAESALPEVTQW